MQAFEKLKPTEQLEAFLVQASIRVYWMERLLMLFQEGELHRFHGSRCLHQ